MAWTYYCADDKVTLSADTKEQLAEKMMQHMRSLHNKVMSREEAMQSVNQDARQSAA